VASLGRSLWKGDWGGALLDVVGFVPGLGAAGKGTRLAKKMATLKKSIDVGTSAVSKAMKGTKKAATKYWDDLAKKNRKAYEDAIKGCGRNKACKESKAGLKGPQYKNTPVSGKNGQWKGERGDGTWVPKNGGPPIKYENGFPNYDKHSKMDVEIPMRGDHTTDFQNATKASEAKLREMYGKKWKTGWKKDYTWHHKQDGATMQLVPKNIHGTGGGASTPHMGGASLYGSGGNARKF